MVLVQPLHDSSRLFDHKRENMNQSGLHVGNDAKRFNSSSNFPLTPPQEVNQNEHLNCRSDSPYSEKVVNDECRSSVIQSIGSVISSTKISKGISFQGTSSFLSPESNLSASPVRPAYLHEPCSTLEKNVSTSQPLINLSIPPVSSNGLIITSREDRSRIQSVLESSYDAPTYLTSLSSVVPYKQYFRGRFSSSSDIPRPFKNYAKKYIASLRESKEFLKFKYTMMSRMNNDNIATSSSSTDECSEQVASFEDEDYTDDKLNEPADSGVKSPGYWERRRKNNVAAKKSRDLRRQKEDELAIFAAFLDQENEKLREENALMLKRCKYLEKYLQFNEQPLVSAEFESCASTFNYNGSPPSFLNEEYMEEYLLNP